MKRADELVALSHDHHQALFQAMQLKRASSPGDGVEPFLAFWREHASAHFRIEEEVLLPGWAQLGGGFDSALAERVLSEHLSLRAEVLRLQAGTLDLEGQRAIGEALERHVRFEERELFPAIQTGLAPADLAQLGARLAEAEAALEAPAD